MKPNPELNACIWLHIHFFASLTKYQVL